MICAKFDSNVYAEDIGDDFDNRDRTNFDQKGSLEPSNQVS